MTTTRTAQPQPHLQFDTAMLSNVGAVRPSNEDTVLYAAPPDQDSAAKRGMLALVADGMGGHAAGEVASALAAETIRRVFYTLEGSTPQVLVSAFAAANQAIRDWTVSHPECAGMGTTCTALALHESKLWLAHIGDSRAYLLRNGSFTQLSADQTLVEELVRKGKLTKKQAETSPVNNVVLQALGMGPEIAPIIWSQAMPLLAGDIVVLCTDGLSGLVQDDVIADIAGRLRPHEACEALIEAALAAGGHDNVSVGVLRAETPAEQTTASAKATRQLRVPDQDGNDERAAAGGETRTLKIPKSGGGRNA
jgi:PPM family protein phosphatase